MRHSCHLAFATKILNKNLLLIRLLAEMGGKNGVVLLLQWSVECVVFLKNNKVLTVRKRAPFLPTTKIVGFQ